MALVAVILATDVGAQATDHLFRPSVGFGVGTPSPSYSGKDAPLLLDLAVAIERSAARDLVGRWRSGTVSARPSAGAIALRALNWSGRS